jgi:hypothetical protein
MLHKFFPNNRNDTNAKNVLLRNRLGNTFDANAFPMPIYRRNSKKQEAGAALIDSPAYVGSYRH